MDTALQNGDFKLSSGGTNIDIVGKDEILQRCAVMLQCRRGKFVYDSSLGSKLYMTDFADFDEVEHVCLDILDGTGVKLEQLEISGNTAALTLLTSYGRGTITIRKEGF